MSNFDREPGIGTAVNDRSTSDPAATADLAAIHARVRRSIATERGIVARLRALPTGRRIAIGVAGVGLMVLVPLALVHPRRGFDGWGMRSAIFVGAYVLLLVVGLRAALRPMQVRASAKRDAAVVAMAFVAPLALARIAPGVPVEPFPVGYCFFIGTAAGWGLLLLLRALDRSGHRDRGALWLALGVVGLAANLALQLDCLSSDLVHRIVCHSTIGFGIAAQYLLFGHALRARFERLRVAR
jgi:hypothetical protein